MCGVLAFQLVFLFSRFFIYKEITMISPVLLLLPAIHHGASARRTLSQYDQIDAEQGTPPTLNVDLLVKWINSTNTNTFNFLLWDTDGHQYLDMVRFLEQTKDMEVGGVGGGPIDVWITLVPRTETVPGHLVPQHPQPGRYAVVGQV